MKVKDIDDLDTFDGDTRHVGLQLHADTKKRQSDARTIYIYIYI